MLSHAASKDPAMTGQLKYERREADFYATPPENVNCLTHFLNLSQFAVWESACGEGHISKRLAQFVTAVVSSDLRVTGFGTGGVNFLTTTKLPPVLLTKAPRQAIVTNPPFAELAEQFVRHALELTKPVGGVVAMFLRNEWDMSSEDRPDLFEGHPAYAMKICVTKRPRFIEGSKGSPRHSYAWYVWDWLKPPEIQAPIRYIHPNNAGREGPATIH